MKNIEIMIQSLLVVVGLGQFLYGQDSLSGQFVDQGVAISHISEIINNTYSQLIVTSPDIKNGDIFISKNISLTNGKVSIPQRPIEYTNALMIEPKTKSMISNLKLPVIGASIDNQFDYKIRSNNYNPGTIHAVCIDLPPQKFQLNYSIVHKPLPVIALRQKGNLLNILEGDGLSSIYLNNNKILAPLYRSITPFVEEIEHGATYSIEVNQIKPIGHFESIRHNSEDLSTMYLDGGAWVSPLRLNPNTLDIVIKRKK